MNDDVRPDLSSTRQLSTNLLHDSMASSDGVFSPRASLRELPRRSHGMANDTDVFGGRPQPLRRRETLGRNNANKPSLMQGLTSPRRQVMTQTLLASALGLGITAATAAAVPPVIGLAPTLISGVGYLGASTAVHALGAEHVLARTAAFGTGFVCLGLLVSGLTLLSSGVLTQAAILTAASVGVLSALVYLLPATALERVYPALLGVSSALLVLSIVALFMPSGPLAVAVRELAVWGGLICGMGTFAHTLERACRPSDDGAQGDPLSMSMGMVSAMVQMFTDYAIVLARRED